MRSCLFAVLLAALVSPFVALRAGAEVPKVVADIAPVHSLVAMVMKDMGVPTLIVEPGLSPHGLSLRPSQARSLQEADLVVWIGEALTPWLARPLSTLSAGSSALELLELPGTRVLPTRDVHDDDHSDTRDAHNDDHDDTHDGHDDHEGDQDGHDHGDIDPHAWLDPENAIVWVDAIAEELARLDPENARAYRANADAAQEELRAMSRLIGDSLVHEFDKPFIVFHDAFQYFERRFGLELAGTVSLGDASAPSPARLAALRARIADFGVACAFTEPQLSADLMAAAVEGTGVAVSVLDPLGARLEPGPQLYTDMMTGMSETILMCPAG